MENVKNNFNPVVNYITSSRPFLMADKALEIAADFFIGGSIKIFNKIFSCMSNQREETHRKSEELQQIKVVHPKSKPTESKPPESKPPENKIKEKVVAPPTKKALEEELKWPDGLEFFVIPHAPGPLVKESRPTILADVDPEKALTKKETKPLNPNKKRVRLIDRANSPQIQQLDVTKVDRLRTDVEEKKLSLEAFTTLLSGIEEKLTDLSKNVRKKESEIEELEKKLDSTFLEGQLTLKGLSSYEVALIYLLSLDPKDKDSLMKKDKPLKKGSKLTLEQLDMSVLADRAPKAYKVAKKREEQVEIKKNLKTGQSELIDLKQQLTEKKKLKDTEIKKQSALSIEIEKMEREIEQLA